jgi:hypothetical protein
MESLYENIGGKIKRMAYIIFWVFAIVSVVGGLVVLSESPIAGIVIMIVGPLVAWISTFLLYGFGELIESNQIIAQNLSRAAHKQPFYTQKSDTGTAEIEKLREQGLITEEEYQALSAKKRN